MDVAKVAAALFIAAVVVSGSTGVAADASAHEHRLVLPLLVRDGMATGDRVLTGVWGGPGIRLTIEAGDIARLEFDCAYGEVRGARPIAADGSFAWDGIYVRERGGPVEAGVPEDSHPAAYSGTVTGAGMRLTIRLTDEGTTLGPYTLVDGSTGRILKCL
ncbi:MAG: hypothetical protein ACKVT1_20520 [Dehalococcoidia bacterium]